MKAVLTERDIAAYLVERVASEGGVHRKVSWEGRADAPDYLVMLNGLYAFVETKAPGKKPRASQLREFVQMDNAGGLQVLVVTTRDEADELVHGMTHLMLLPPMIEKLSYKRFLPCDTKN